MCGIAGLFNYHSEAESSSEVTMKKMLSVIRHRGPDETGLYLGENIAMGMVRLSIVDLASGQQPISDSSGNYWIVYNGEIFNYIELRSALEKIGVHFSTNSDTEVIVQMYARFGAGCLQYFNGQFAFCIWDRRKQSFFLARDRVGIRPLYYWTKNRAFAFCSEIKGLFTLNKINRSISTQSLAQIFTCWTTLSPATPFEGVYELPPGHFMHVDSTGIRIRQFWSLNFPGSGQQYNWSLSEAGEALNDLLSDAVKIRLRADVPVGAYLSGGLDSSLTTSLIKEVNPEILNTFSIGFKDELFNETPYQEEAAAYFGTNHTSFECTSPEIADQFIETIWHAESPLLRTSPTPMLLLSKKVRERNIKVVITGEGADEFLAGYNIFKEAKVRRFWANEPTSGSRPLLLKRLYPYLPMMKDANTTALKLFFGYKLTETADPLYSHLLRWHNTSRLKAFFSGDLLSTINGYDPLEEIRSNLPEAFSGWSGLAQSQYLEAKIFMSGYLLSAQGDRMAMANSVEGRYPFLDYRVIEFCNSLPDRFKLNCLDEKFILKKISESKVPSSIVKRTKQPYRAPITSSFFNDSAPSYVSEMLSENRIKEFGLFDAAKVQSLVKKARSRQIVTEVDQMAIAGILSTQLLSQLFINNRPEPDPDSLDNIKIVREYHEMAAKVY